MVVLGYFLLQVQKFFIKNLFFLLEGFIDCFFLKKNIYRLQGGHYRKNNSAKGGSVPKKVQKKTSFLSQRKVLGEGVSDQNIKVFLIFFCFHLKIPVFFSNLLLHCQIRTPSGPNLPLAEKRVFCFWTISEPPLGEHHMAIPKLVMGKDKPCCKFRNSALFSFTRFARKKKIVNQKRKKKKLKSKKSLNMIELFFFWIFSKNYRVCHPLRIQNSLHVWKQFLR